VILCQPLRTSTSAMTGWTLPSPVSAADIEKYLAKQTRWIVGWMTGLVASAAAIIIAVLG